MYLTEDVTVVSDSTFMMYVIALGVSGALLLLVALIGFGSTVASRVISAVVGLAFAGYAIYLQFLMPDDATFNIFYAAFIVPVLVLIQVFRSRKQKREADAAGTPAAPAA
jgi:phosphate/sulfate permease